VVPAVLLFLFSLPMQNMHAVQLTHFSKLSETADVQIWRRLHFSRTRDVSQLAVFARAKDELGMQVLRQMGLKASDRWNMVHLNNAQLRTALQGHVDLRTSPALRPMLDISVPDVGGDLVHLGKGLKAARTGKGVLVGIVDTGVDLSHPAFWQNDRTRVVAIWDQDAIGGRAPAGFGYGNECRQAQIQAGDCGIEDDIGHGTHVAGIAAGSIDPDGMAPRADIAVARSSTFTRLADAILYLVALADERQQPLVVNISVGGQYGPHDGKTPLEQYIGSVAGPGRLFVAAAGNDGGDRVHVGLNLTQDAVRVPVIGVPQGVSTSAIVEFWTRGAHDLQLAFEVWDNQALVSGVQLSASTSEILSAIAEPYAHITYSRDRVPEHDLWRHVLEINCSDAIVLPPTATFAIALKGSGKVHAWISQTDYRYGYSRFGSSSEPGWISGDGLLSITVPSTSPKIISVGSYTVRTQWVSDVDGNEDLGPYPLGSIAAYSSSGPTIDPIFTGFKPDIAAPGSVIGSARAWTVGSGPNTVAGQRVMMQGTSMSAPHVTGALALMLEVDPRLSPKRALDILKLSARQDGFTGETPSNAWGYGKLDAHAAVALVENHPTESCTSTGVLHTWSLLLGLAFAARKLSKINKIC
jgi:minor extracellular serine protease Vpr